MFQKVIVFSTPLIPQLLETLPPCALTKLFARMGKGKYDDDYDRRDNDRGFDEIESLLLKEEMWSNSKASALLHGGDYDRKINLSTRIQNDITRSEKKGEKRSTNQDKNDRATSEQVLDPRTRLILFKLLSNGFLEEIDGKSKRFHYWQFKKNFSAIISAAYLNYPLPFRTRRSHPESFPYEWRCNIFLLCGRSKN